MMIIGYAFAFMVEGASGFGTPVAIAAPILIALGFEPIKVVIRSIDILELHTGFIRCGWNTYLVWFWSIGVDESADRGTWF